MQEPVTTVEIRRIADQLADVAVRAHADGAPHSVTALLDSAHSIMGHAWVAARLAHLPDGSR